MTPERELSIGEKLAKQEAISIARHLGNNRGEARVQTIAEQDREHKKRFANAELPSPIPYIRLSILDSETNDPKH